MSVGEEKKETTLKFKMPFGAVIWLLFIGNFLGFALLLPSMLSQRTHLTVSLQQFSAVIWILAFIFDVFAGLILVECFKVKLKPSGISCFNFWGIYSFVLWDEMREVKTFNCLGLKYIRVFFRNSRIPLWVPLFIKNRSGFSKALSEFAPVDNLLRQAFAQNG
jgi:hypothetical protein